MRGIETAFIGTLGADPEQRTSKTGRPWASFRVAVSTGKDAEATTWLRVATFSETAIKATADLRKGTSVYVEGSLRQTEWQDREGQTRTGLEVMAWKVEPLALLGHRRPAKEPASGRERAPSPEPATSENGRQASAKREWQRPPHDTDPRPAGGPPPHNEIPFAAETR